LYLLFIFVFSLILPFVFIKLIHPLLKKIIEKKNKKLFNNLIKLRFFYTLGYTITPIIILLALNNINLANKNILNELLLIKKIAGLWVIISFSIIFNKLVSAFNYTFKKSAFFIKYPITSYLQLFKLLIFLISAILALCLALNLSPWGILSGIGALGAILLLVFKDTILGLVASIQIYGGDLIKEGDWIELKALDIDGEVIEVGLHRVKVKAWDNTITTFPTSKFLELTFKNWRGMTESGGRRIKRKLIINLSSIKFIDERLSDKLYELSLLEDYVKEKKIELNKENNKKKVGNINRRTLTNIGCFRIYLKKYLENHPKINKDMTLLVRQLPISQYGLPIEIYTFTSTTNWKLYEDIQSDIFDHILASIHYFDLEVYQEPTSTDLKSLMQNFSISKTK